MLPTKKEISPLIISAFVLLLICSYHNWPNWSNNGGLIKFCSHLKKCRASTGSCTVQVLTQCTKCVHNWYKDNIIMGYSENCVFHTHSQPINGCKSDYGRLYWSGVYRWVWHVLLQVSLTVSSHRCLPITTILFKAFLMAQPVLNHHKQKFFPRG